MQPHAAQYGPTTLCNLCTGYGDKSVKCCHMDWILLVIDRIAHCLVYFDQGCSLKNVHKEERGRGARRAPATGKGNQQQQQLSGNSKRV